MTATQLRLLDVRFFHALMHDDDLAAIVRGQTFIESRLQTLVSRNLRHPELIAWDEGSWTFARLREYAETIRERKRGAQAQDFDLIGTEFHRWIHDHEKELYLVSADDFARLIETNLDYYGRWYERIRKASVKVEGNLEAVYFNAENKFTLQYPLIMAALRVEDAEAEALQKICIVAGFVDILVARRTWNFKAIDYSTMHYTMFLLMREIRRKSAAEIAELLVSRIEDDGESFATNDRFHLHGMNGPQVHRILARITTYIETNAGMPSRYEEYAQRSGKNGYEIEHIWANHSERHLDEFEHPSDFLDYRNRIGGLLLLPKKFNASYGDLPYSDKVTHYNSQNLIARSLHDDCYSHNPGFRSFIKSSGLPFRPHSVFRRNDLDDRQKLYSAVAEMIWDPRNLLQLRGHAKLG